MICKPEQGLICALVCEEHEVDDGVSLLAEGDVRLSYW